MIKSLCVTAFLLMSLAGFSQTKDSIYTTVDNEASFPGGDSAWVRYLNKNMRFPQEAIEKVRGRKTRRWEVYIAFVVTKDGKLKDLKPETSNGWGFEEESMRLLRKSPDWIPAKVNGQPVDSYTRKKFMYILEQ